MAKDVNQNSESERRKELLYDNMDLLIRHRKEIQESPRYANVDASFALDGFMPCCFFFSDDVRRLAEGAGGDEVRLSLSSLLDIWETDVFKDRCHCGVGRCDGTTRLVRVFIYYGTWNSRRCRGVYRCLKCGRTWRGGGELAPSLVREVVERIFDAQVEKASAALAEKPVAEGEPEATIETVIRELRQQDGVAAAENEAK
ncbi:MAG: hypothetical protein J6Z50_06875 [Fibrobacterales bacterium]|nr:hypothetical protein [Fibrobacterales bacterium]MBP5188836.1 hypothetical protein [Fibrobacterales bacterium]